MLFGGTNHGGQGRAILRHPIKVIQGSYAGQHTFSHNIQYYLSLVHREVGGGISTRGVWDGIVEVGCTILRGQWSPSLPTSGQAQGRPGCYDGPILQGRNE